MATKKSSGKADTKTSRCWPGFEPVPGKSEHEEGSCRKKPASRNGGKDADRETSRKKQVAAGGERGRQAKAKSPDAAERRSVSTAAKTPRKSAAKKAASKKATAGSARKSASTTAARKKRAGTRTSGVAAKSAGRAKKSST